MSTDYLMYIASVGFFICYIPDFFANVINKNLLIKLINEFVNNNNINSL
jgi:hypothetical protein